MYRHAEAGKLVSKERGKGRKSFTATVVYSQCFLGIFDCDLDSFHLMLCPLNNSFPLTIPNGSIWSFIKSINRILPTCEEDRSNRMLI